MAAPYTHLLLATAEAKATVGRTEAVVMGEAGVENIESDKFIPLLFRSEFVWASRVAKHWENALALAADNLGNKRVGRERRAAHDRAVGHAAVRHPQRGVVHITAVGVAEGVLDGSRDLAVELRDVGGDGAGRGADGHHGQVDPRLVELELLRRLLPALAVGSVESGSGACVVVESNVDDPTAARTCQHSQEDE